MLYKKPNKVKYTDMAIFIDNNVYKEDLTEEEDSLIFEYLFHIARMLAYKSGYFKRAEYYDDFAVYFATSMYIRLKNPKQFEINEDSGEPRLEKIKSVLNYMKNVAYMRKVEFEQEFYSQSYSQELDDDDIVEYDMDYSFVDKLSESIEDISNAEFCICLGDVCRTTKAFLKQIPYKTYSVVWYNIYLSCLLTLLNCITLSNRTISRVENLKNDIQNRPKAWANLYKTNPDSHTVLYHLDRSMSGYVWILVQEIKHLLAKDLSLSTHTYIPYNSSMNMIALADINLEDYTGYGD